MSRYKPTPRKKPARNPRCQGLNGDGAYNDRVYSEEETRFLLAMQRLKERLGRRPTWAEVLREARYLGYKRVIPCEAVTQALA